jgi:glycosyltransferase involved in cell wall biosynthesis
MLWQPADPSVELSVVVPFYNPGPSVGTTVRRLVDLARNAGIGLEVIAVSDGSTDGSETHVTGIGPEVRLLVQPVNRGKGAALRRGFAAARGRAVGFVDADGDIDPAHLLAYLEVLRSGGDVVYACKRSGASASESSGFRKLVSLGFSSLVTVLFRHGVRDTQTGCKILRREVAADVLPWMRENRFAFDLELFVVAHRRGHRDLRPAPVRLGERLAGSTVTAKAILRTLRDTITIWGRLHLARAYPATGGAVVAFPSRPADLAPMATAA